MSQFPMASINSIAWMYLTGLSHYFQGFAVKTNTYPWYFLQIKVQKWIWWEEGWALVKGFWYVLPCCQQKGLLVDLHC